MGQGSRGVERENGESIAIFFDRGRRCLPVTVYVPELEKFVDNEKPPTLWAKIIVIVAKF